MPTIEVNGVNLAYHEAGAGEPVVALHCTAGSGEQWRALQAELAAYRVLAPDLHGHGETDPWPGRGALSLTDEAVLVGALIDRGERPVHLVGHSYGGAVALSLALQQTHRLRSLTLIEPVAFHLLRNGGAVDRALFAEIGAVADAVSAALTTGDYWPGLECFVDYWNGAGAFAQMSATAQMALSRQIATIALNFWAANSESMMLEAHSRIRVPTLLLSGDRSAATTRRIAEMLAATIPDARTAVVEGAGHMLPLTHRDEVNARIAAHVRRHSTAWLEAA